MVIVLFDALTFGTVCRLGGVSKMTSARIMMAEAIGRARLTAVKTVL
jgi:hypothetical protein